MPTRSPRAHVSVRQYACQVVVNIMVPFGVPIDNAAHIRVPQKGSSQRDHDFDNL